jgi:tRNA threonylcarbamoyladenosine biosynthesis protein TsaE
MATVLPPVSYTLTAIHVAAQQVLQSASRIIAFSGGLGAGKTTLISAICNQLGVTDPVSSPTFSLINEYHLPEGSRHRFIYHMDWYRLRDADEAINAGMEDCLQQADAWCFIEWPEQAPELLAGPHLYITIENKGEGLRCLLREQR